jgi:hypothetical protein
MEPATADALLEGPEEKCFTKGQRKFLVGPMSPAMLEVNWWIENL